MSKPPSTDSAVQGASGSTKVLVGGAAGATTLVIKLVEMPFFGLGVDSQEVLIALAPISVAALTILFDYALSFFFYRSPEEVQFNRRHKAELKELNASIKEAEKAKETDLINDLKAARRELIKAKVEFNKQKRSQS